LQVEKEGNLLSLRETIAEEHCHGNAPFLFVEVTGRIASSIVESFA